MTDRTGKLARMRLQLSEFDLIVVHQAAVKHPRADALSRMPTTGMDESPLEDNVQILVIVKTQSEEGKTETDTKVWHRISCIDDMESVKAAFSESLQVSD